MQTLSGDQLIGQVLGKYRVERFMGQGRLSAVYLARHVSSHQVDALTMYQLPERLSAESRNRLLQRFLKEAALVAGLHHPHILSIYDYGELSGAPYLVTPYTMQGSLADIIKQRGRCGHAYVGSLLSQIAAGLNYAHQRHFVHGTLKPANIVLRGEESIQVAGFGLMHMLQRSGIEPMKQPYEHLLSVADTFLAATEYIAPEVVEGKNIDARSDIYALGCILFELLSGRPPFVGPDPFETAQQHVQHNVPSLRSLVTDVPIALASVISQAVERDPARRFQSVLELDEAFAQASQGAIHFTQPVPAVQARLTRNLQSVTPGQTSAMKRMPPLNPSGNWQLVPPIVTQGRLPAIQPTGSRNVAAESALGGYQQRRDRKELLPDTDAYIVPAPPTLPPVVPAQPVNDVSTKPAQKESLPSQEQQEYPSNVSFVGTPEQIAEDARTYAWWSPETPARSDPKPSAKQEMQRAQGPDLLATGARGAVRLPSGGDLNWMSEPPKPAASSKRNTQTTAQKTTRNRKVRRREVVAMLATGVVVVGAGAVGVKAGILHLGGTNTNAQQNGGLATTTTKTTTTKTGKGQTQPVSTQKKGQTNGQAATVGTPISTTKQAVNTAVAFKNPQDHMDSLLIRLPNGNFVAYKRACTHQGVDVNYDPATQTLICPLHGATFDAKNNAAVLKGPAQTPLTMTAVRVNANGVISVV